jgi:hypothetical protein
MITTEHKKERKFNYRTINTKYITTKGYKYKKEHNR